ncbi:MAG TPA: two-component regulator propeller domain-containing protein [Myxococcaceae bacterium]|nr:two-component regulator propeller domain-containing protein [Myxococcaceae bacterium]
MGALLVITWALALGAPPDAPEYASRRWTRFDGLPQNTVFSLAQRPDHTLIAGTEEGAASFDGRAFRPVAREWLERRGRRFVTALLAGGDALWIGTSADGALRLPSSPSGQEVHVLPGAYVAAMARGPRGDLWIASSRGVARWSEGTLAELGASDGLPAAGAAAIAVTVDAGGPERAWAAIGDALWRFDGRRWSKVPGLDGVGPSALAAGRSGRLWLGTAGGEVETIEGDRVERPVSRGPALGSIKALLETADGEVWIAASAGLFLLREGGPQPVLGPDGAPVQESLSLVEGAERDVWVGLRNGGLLRFRRTAVTMIDQRAGLRSSNVQSVAGDPSGGLWIGTEGGGASYLRDGKVIATWAGARSLGSDSVNAVWPEENGAWLGLVGAGLRHLEGGRVGRPPGLAPLDQVTVYALRRDGAGRLWIGTHDRGVYWWDGRALEHLGAGPGALPHERVFALEPWPAGGVWVGTREGLALVRDGAVVRRELNGIQVLALHRGVDGTLWIGTDSHGLYWLRGDALGHASRTEGLLSHIIFQILEERPEDGDGLWMSCNHGLFRVSRVALLELEQGRRRRVEVEAIGRDDGMKEEGNGGKQPAGWRSPDGALWFATGGGVARVDPRAFAASRNVAAPTVRIDQVVADGVEIADPGAAVSVPPGRGSLVFRYAGVSLASPEGLHYQRRLEGFDEAWIDAGGETTAQYTNLPPGTYRFLVKAAQGAYWSDALATGAVELQPHLSQRPAFRVAVALALALLGVAAYQARARRWRAETMVLAERNRLAREIHDGLMQSLTGILIQLQAAVALSGDRRDEPRTHVERALEWAHHSLADARLAVSALGREVASVKALSDLLARCGEALTAGTSARAEVRLQGDEALPPKIGGALLRIGQEAMSNAVRHGRPKVVTVELGAGDGAVRMVVRDDGAGFEPGRDGSGAGNGLRNMRARAEEAGATLELTSAPGRGTEVRVSTRPRRRSAR